MRGPIRRDRRGGSVRRRRSLQQREQQRAVARLERAGRVHRFAPSPVQLEERVDDRIVDAGGLDPLELDSHATELSFEATELSPEVRRPCDR